MDVREVVDKVEQQWAAMIADGYPTKGTELVFLCNKTFEFRDTDNNKILLRGVWR
jgi:hypothetical protein